MLTGSIMDRLLVGCLFALLVAGQGPVLTVAGTVTMTPACETCLIGVHLMEDLLCDASATDFLVSMVEKGLCPVLGNTPKCRNLAEGLLPVVVQYIRTAVTPAQLCSTAGVCGAQLLGSPQHDKMLMGTSMLSNYLDSKPALRVRDNSQCDMCEYIVGAAQQGMKGGEMSIITAANQACEELPAQLSKGCKRTVTEYEAMLQQFITVDMDPYGVCSLLGACPVGLTTMLQPAPLPASLARGMRCISTLAQSFMLGAATQQYSQNSASLMSSASQNTKAADSVQQTAVVPGTFGGVHGVKKAGGLHGPLNDVCDVCKMAVIEAHALIANPAVQADLLNYTLAVCDSLQTLAADCKTYVVTYAPLVFSLLEQYLIPEQLCGTIGVCPLPPHPATTAMTTFTSSSTKGLLPRSMRLLPGRTLDVALLEKKQLLTAEE